jgi:hypothetical protein
VDWWGGFGNRAKPREVLKNDGKRGAGGGKNSENNNKNLENVVKSGDLWLFVEKCKQKLFTKCKSGRYSINS